MPNVKVSVVVPVYNVEDCLAECIDSIINQSLKDIEIICVNDGSTDGSSRILEEYAKRDDRIIIINQKNAGLGAARNTGLDAAKGEWVSFIDSDDWIERETYESMIKQACEQACSVEAIVFGIMPFGDDVSSKELESRKKYFKVKYNGLVEATDDVVFNTEISVCNRLFKLSKIKEFELRFSVGKYYEDAAFLMSFGMRAKNLYYVAEAFYKYRQRAGSIMHDTNVDPKKWSDQLFVIQDIYNYIDKHNIKSEHFEMFAKIFERWLKNAINISNSNQHSDVIARARKMLAEFRFDSSLTEASKILKELQKGIYKGVVHKKKSLATKIGEAIVSIKKKNGRKVVRIFGIKVH